MYIIKGIKNAPSALLSDVGTEKHEPNFFLKISKCLYNSTMLEEQVFLFLLNYVRSYRRLRLRALYLNSALVRRKARALWKYNELVLTNHGARISLDIL